MQIRLKRGKDALNYIGTNERGQEIRLSGDKQAVGPMESVLMAAAGCSTIDLELILGKMRQTLSHVEVVVDAERAEDETPKVFKKIHLHYVMVGKIKEDKAAQAVEMSAMQYCSVLTMLMKSVDVTTSFEIIENQD
jgi:putative redox protein